MQGEEDAARTGVLHLRLQEREERALAHECAVDDLARLNRETVVEHGYGAVGAHGRGVGAGFRRELPLDGGAELAVDGAGVGVERGPRDRGLAFGLFAFGDDLRGCVRAELVGRLRQKVDAARHGFLRRPGRERYRGRRGRRRAGLGRLELRGRRAGHRLVAAERSQVVRDGGFRGGRPAAEPVADRAEWETDPFEATVIDRRVHGLGAGNCKGSMAVQIWLAEEIARRGGPATGEVMFTFVGDEETLGPDGLAYLRENGAVRPDVLICGAQTQLQAITEERGVIWIEITTTGTSAHAGEPQNGDNAIDRMVRVINELNHKLQPKLESRRRGGLRSTMSIGIIDGGTNTNAVPSACRIEIDRRLMPEESIEDMSDNTS